MSKHKKQIADYQKQSRNMFLILNVSVAIIALNAVVVITGVADSYYNWIISTL
jgi:hypothetical protein